MIESDLILKLGRFFISRPKFSDFKWLILKIFL